MISLNKEEKIYYKKMLSETSKLGVKSISLDAKKCKTGSKLAKKSGTVCNGCYALKGCYVFPVVKNAMARRLEFFNSSNFIPIMVWLLQSQKKKFFRWFDSGDIQNVFMGLNILEVCKLTPDIKHWIPTKEYKFWRQVLKIEKLPDNVCLRISSPNIDQEPLKGFNNTSTVHENKKAFGLECIAYKQEGKCLDCKACYDPKIKNISYPKH
tara:strand:+ start:394 stop:1023 length:630 start_codon:yes stop_codon:yes gene_type:complete